MIERIKVVAATDVVVADPNLRHTVAPGCLAPHFVAQIRSASYIYLGEGDEFTLQQLLRHIAIWAECSCIYDNGGHGIQF